MGLKNWFSKRKENKRIKEQEKRNRKNRELEEIVDRSVNRAISKHYGKKLNRIDRFIKSELQFQEQERQARKEHR